MIDVKNPFEVKILLSYDDFDDDTAAARAVRILKKDLEIEKAHVIVAEHLEDTKAIFNSDPSIHLRDPDAVHLVHPKTTT